MIYLLLAILSTSLISVLMRLSNKYVKNNMVMFSANYTICGILAVLFAAAEQGKAAFDFSNVSQGGLKFALVLGIISGIMYLATFVVFEYNIKRNGMVLSSIFMKLGVIVPVLMAMALSWDEPSAIQLVGCLLALAAIIIINGEGKTQNAEEIINCKNCEDIENHRDSENPEGHDSHESYENCENNKKQQNLTNAAVIKKNEKGNNFGGMWLIVLLISSGFTDSLSNVYEKIGEPELKNQFLVFLFLTSILASTAFVFIKKQKYTAVDIIWGVLIGIPNYFSARFLLYALSSISAIVAYPVFNVGAIMLISLMGFVLFKEKLSKRKILGLGIIILAIVLLNL